MIISTGLLTRNVRGEFFNRFNAAQTYYQRLATTLKSSTATENYRWLGSVPQMREWVGGRQAKGLRAESYDVANLKYEATMEVDRDEVSDDQTGQIMIRVGELAQRAATHKDYLIAQLLINGATAGFNSYDGVSFFNDAHVSGNSGNQDNKLTLEAASGTNPTSAEFLTALTNAISAMLGFKDDQGQPMMLDAKGIAAIVPPALWPTATQAVQAQMLNNTTNVFSGIAEVICFPWLTDATKFYTLKTSGRSCSRTASRSSSVR